MCLGSIYGPNLDENILIYDQIEQTVIEQDCESTILGGEWWLELYNYVGLCRCGQQHWRSGHGLHPQQKQIWKIKKIMQ